MSTPLFKDDIALAETFQLLLDKDILDDFGLAVSKLLAGQAFYPHTFRDLLKEKGLESAEQLKPSLLDLLLTYMNEVLDDHIITEQERYNVNMLKKCFQIEEGDFLKYRQHGVEKVLARQFERLYADDIVDKGEAMHSVSLQELFGLSYDQFDAIKSEAIKGALKRGADITDLDTAQNPSKL